MVTIADAERIGLSLSKVNPKGAVGYTVGYGKPPVEHQFKPGQGGRPRGSRNKLGEDFINALADDFAKHGAVAIERVREEKPDAYLKVIATLMPWLAQALRHFRVGTHGCIPKFTPASECRELSASAPSTC